MVELPVKKKYFFRDFKLSPRSESTGVLILCAHVSQYYVSSVFICGVSRTPPYEDGTDSVFRNVGKYHLDAGESHKRKNTSNIYYWISYNFVTEYLTSA